ncbi:hypothetical protein IWT25_00724 [Secundilactobacillus pentosiphilus]|uniref:Uncharacterized protein n=1 Tax=Secundilactobacillus pentosiphilus TaxID=1714682 RepID=A0A1Z5IUH4_9LACO|nr:hypothetical protein [Secundilactobacillus pentosiphilus]GAX05420.1 hypothetical protein IWT25_00724 [Secundilactobacillus pentosiphilus]
MEQWQLLGFNDREVYHTGTKAECIRWMNDSYKGAIHIAPGKPNNLLPQPMLIVKYYPDSPGMVVTEKPAEKKQHVNWLDSETKILEQNLHASPHELKQQIPRHSENAINARLTIVRAEMRDKYARHNQ